MRRGIGGTRVRPATPGGVRRPGASANAPTTQVTRSAGDRQTWTAPSSGGGVCDPAQRVHHASTLLAQGPPLALRIRTVPTGSRRARTRMHALGGMPCQPRHMDTVPLSAEALLTDYFTRAPHLRHPSLRGRAPRLQAAITAHLEARGAAHLRNDELFLFEAERQLEPHGAVVRTMGPVSLLTALTELLRTLPWPADVREASARLHLLTGLRAWIVEAAPQVVHDPALAALTEALHRAHIRLEAERRSSSQAC